MTLILAELEWLALQLIYRSYVPHLNQLGPFKRVGGLNSFGRWPSIRCRLRGIKYRIIRSPTLFVSELKKSSRRLLANTISSPRVWKFWKFMNPDLESGVKNEVKPYFLTPVTRDRRIQWNGSTGLSAGSWSNVVWLFDSSGRRTYLWGYSGVSGSGTGNRLNYDPNRTVHVSLQDENFPTQPSYSFEMSCSICYRSEIPSHQQILPPSETVASNWLLMEDCTLIPRKSTSTTE